MYKCQTSEQVKALIDAPHQYHLRQPSTRFKVIQAMEAGVQEEQERNLEIGADPRFYHSFFFYYFFFAAS